MNEWAHHCQLVDVNMQSPLEVHATWDEQNCHQYDKFRVTSLRSLSALIPAILRLLTVDAGVQVIVRGFPENGGDAGILTYGSRLGSRGALSQRL